MYLAPDQVFQELFIEMHQSGVWADGKTISDITPLFEPTLILNKYRNQKSNSDFDLKTFVEQHFEIPESPTSNFKSDISLSVEEHINSLWEHLQRKADTARLGSSLIPLPHPYIVPGGRFNEIYYWDSYFTMLGLQVSGQVDIIENMIRNFAYLIDTFGFIPNGNRTYFLSRSQPPFFSLMVGILAEEKGDKIIQKYLPQLLKEHQFWMDDLDNENIVSKRTVRLADNEFLNRYFDNTHSPRAEMYATDLECAEETNRNPKQLYLDLRAACESGWDFSSRWLRKNDDLRSIYTSEIIPVDLNCLLFHLEKMIAKGLHLAENPEAQAYELAAEKRQANIQKYHWDVEKGYFMDYDFVQQKRTSSYTLAGIYPLFFNIASPQQATACAKMIKEKFLRAGGVVSTEIKSGQQWDAPNGWAPLQWMCVKGLLNYEHHDLANTIKKRWLSLNTKVFKSTGKMLEKYNVEDIDLPTGGGEYPVQDGFGWTNGVFLKLISCNYSGYPSNLGQPHNKLI